MYWILRLNCSLALNQWIHDAAVHCSNVANPGNSKDQPARAIPVVQQNGLTPFYHSF